MVKFWCEGSYDDKEDKKESIEVEAIAIDVSGSSGDWYVSRAGLVLIWVKYKTE